MKTDDLRRIVAALQAGNVRNARALAEPLYKTNPNDAALLGLLGLIYCQTDDVQRAIPLLERAVTLEPGNKINRVNLGKALFDTGNLARAEAICRADVSGEPTVLRLRAEIAKADGRLGDAAALYETLAQQSPDDYQLWNNLGNCRHEAGDIPGAVAALERAKALNPNDASVRLNMSRALASAERYQDSLDEIRAAARLSPDLPGVELDLGLALHRLGFMEESIAPLATAARRDRTNPEIFEAIGHSYAGLAAFDRAEQAYRMAIHVKPGWPSAYVSLSTLLEQSNRQAEIGPMLEQARAAGASEAELAYPTALALRHNGDLEGALRKLIDAPTGVNPVILAQLTGQIADRLGKTDIAFRAFERMNAEVARLPSARAFTGDEHRLYVEQITQLLTPEWVSSWARVKKDTGRPAPAFLVGFPRSGTTLLDTVLMGHPGTHVLEEEPVLANVMDALGGLAAIGSLDEAGVQALRARYFEELDKISAPAPGKLVIDKLPLNLLRMPLIHRLFPEAKLILALRHPCDSVLSCWMQNFKINRAMASFLDIRNAALLYDRAFGFWLKARALTPLATHEIRYEDMVENLEAQIRPLLAFLDLPWDEKVLDYQATARGRGYIRTPSYSQVTEKIYRRASGRWEGYARNLDDILPILEPWAERLGYGDFGDVRALAASK